MEKNEFVRLWQRFEEKRDPVLLLLYLQELTRKHQASIDKEYKFVGKLPPEGPHLFTLPENLLEECERILKAAAQRSSTTQLRLTIYSQVEAVLVALIVICRNLDNIAFVSSCKLVRYMVELASSAFIQLLQTPPLSAEDLSILSSFITSTCHLLEVLYDPYLIWRAWLRRRTLSPSQFQFQPSLLHSEVVPFLYDSMHCQPSRLPPTLQLHLLHVFGAIVAGAQHNALCATTPATMEVLLSLVLDINLEEEARTLALHTIAYSLVCVQNSKTHQRQVDVKSVLYQVLQTLLKLCCPLANTSLCPLHGLKDLLWNLGELPISKVMQENDILRKLIHILQQHQLQETISSIDIDQKLVAAIIDIFAAFISKGAWAKTHFLSAVGFDAITSTVQAAGPPKTPLISSLLRMATNRPSDILEGDEECNIHHGPIVLLLLSLLPDVESPETQVWLCERLLDSCVGSLHAQMACCQSGVVRAILKLIDRHSVLAGRALGKLLHMLEILGSHSLQPADLKQILLLLRLDSEGKQFAYTVPLIHVLSSVAKQSGWLGAPQHFFILSDHNDGLCLTGGVRQWPGTGFAFHAWLRLDKLPVLSKKFKSNNNRHRRQLYSFLSKFGYGFEAFFTEEYNLVVAVATKKEFHAAAVLENSLDDGKWHCITVCQSPARRPFTNSSVTVYIDGRQRLTAQLKFPSLTESFVYCRVGSGGHPQQSSWLSPTDETGGNSTGERSSFMGTLGGAAWGQISTFIDKDRLAALGSRTLPFRSSLGLLQSEPDPSVQNCATGAQDGVWGAPQCLQGQLGSVCVFQEPLLVQQVKTLFEAGPSCLSLLNEEQLETADLPSKLLFCWDAKAFYRDICCDLSPQHLYNGHLTGGRAACTANIKDVLNCLGGIPGLMPLLENAGKETNTKSQDFSGLSPQRPPLSQQTSLDDSGDEWVLLPTSSYSEWKLEQNPVAGFLLMLLHLAQGHPYNQEQLLCPNGLCTVGWLLQKVPNSLVDVNVLMATQLLVEGSAGCENATDLLKALYQFVLFEFRIWSKGNFPVRIGHIQYLSTIIKDDRKFFRKKYGPQFFLDVVQQFYCDCPALSSEDAKTIRVSLIGLVKYYLTREVNVNEILALINFTITLKNEEMVGESLEMLQSLLESPSAKDQLFLLLYEPGCSELLYGLLFNHSFSSVIKTKALKVIGLLLSTERVYEKNKTRLRLHDLGFSCLTSLLTPQQVSPQMVTLLMEQTIMLDVPAGYQGALTLLHFIRHMEVPVKLDAVKKFLSVLESRLSTGVGQVTKQIGWQECVLSLLVKQPMAGSKTVPTTPLPSLDLMDFALDALETNTETELKSESSPIFNRTTPRRLSRRSSASLRSLEGSGSSDSTTLPPRTPQFLLQLKEHIFDFDFPQILGRPRSGSQSSSLEDLVASSTANGDSSTSAAVATASTTVPNKRSSLAAELDRLLSDPCRLTNQSSSSPSGIAEQEEELCSVISQLVHLLFWKGVEGSGKAAWQERGQVLACINLLALSNDLFQSHLEIKRCLLEKALQACLFDLQEAGQANAVHTENAMELMKLVYDLVVLENVDDNRRLSEKLLEGVLSLLDVLLVFEGPAGQDGWAEMAEMGLGIVLICSATENLELCAMATAKLHALVQTRPFASLEEACHLLATLDNILTKALDTGDQEHYSFLIPVVRALLEKLSPPLHLQRHLPTLPLSSPGPAFFEDFQHYALCSEWKNFIEKVIRPLAKKYTCLRIDEQRDAMNSYWNQCYESAMVSLHKRSREIGESKLRFQSNVMEAFASKVTEEHARYASMIMSQRHQHLLLRKRWRMIKLYLYGPRGPWETRSPISQHWKLSNHENSSRMRLKLTFNLNFDPHLQASRLRDNQGGVGIIPAGSSVGCGLTLVAPRVQQEQEDSLAEEDLQLSAAQMESLESTEKEKSVISEDCELVTLMSVIKGRLELTTSDIYFVDLSSLKDEGERHDFKCPLPNLREVHLRRYNLRRSALEFFLVDQTNFFLNFTPKTRNKIFSRILSLRPVNMIYSHGIRSPAELLKASGLTQKWVNREISNFEYLMHLNTIAGRTFNDLSQYPVFPWILSDYTSSVLDLGDPAVYRDLSKPIAVVKEKNIPDVKAKYDNFVDILGVVEKFHYGTHYSNSAGVLHYLVRMEPFTSLHIELQSGRFDVADRQFHSLEATWRLLMENPNDCKELIPEFFYLPEFLVNMNGFDLGRLQGSKERVDDVRLPLWASSPEEFVYQHRKSLESEYVSAHLHEWIDLIFGCKQKGPAAVEALNVFYYVSYEGAIDLEAIVDPVERAATEGMINNFGQTPCQLLKEAHPRRLAFEEALVRLSKNNIKPTSLFLFLDNLRTFFVEASSSNSPVAFLCLPQGQLQAAKTFRGSAICEPLVTICQKGVLGVHGWLPFDKTKTIPYYYTFDRDPSFNSNKTLRYLGGPFHPSMEITHRLFAVTQDSKLVVSGGHWDNSIRVFSLAKGKNVCTLHVHRDIVTCLALDPGGKHFISGSRDTTCLVWQFNQTNTGSTVNQVPIQRLFGHDSEVTCLALAMDLDLAISGSKDGSVNLHTVREGYFTRTLSPPCGQPLNQQVALLCLSPVGHLCVYTQPKDSEKGGEHCLHLYSINGKHLGGRSASGTLSSMVLAGDYLVTGSLDGVVTIYETFGLQQRCSIPLHIPVMAVCMTPGHSHLLASLDDGKIIIIGISRPS